MKIYSLREPCSQCGEELQVQAVHSDMLEAALQLQYDKHVRDAHPDGRSEIYTLRHKVEDLCLTVDMLRKELVAFEKAHAKHWHREHGSVPNQP